MTSEVIPETRRRRLKLSTTPSSQTTVDVPETRNSVNVESSPEHSLPFSSARRRLERTPQATIGQSTIKEIPTSSETPHAPATFTGRGRLREAAVARSKMTVETKIHRSLALTLEEQANFFHSNWDGQPRETLWPDEIRPTPAPTEEAEAAPAEEAAPSEGAPLLVSELRLRKDALQRNAGIAITLRKEQIEAEEKILSFVPTGIDQNAVPKAEEIRLLEEEGFYVGDRPVMAQRNLERMRERLLHQSGDRASEWFDESGQPLALPDPLRHQPLRILPPSSSASGPRGEKLAVYRKAVAEGTKVVADSDNDLFRLEIAIGRLHFSHHYIFSGEHALASRLHELYSAFVDWQSRDLITYWRQQLDALRLAVSAIAHELANKLGGEDAHAQRQPINGTEIADLRLRHDTYSAQVIFIRRQLNAEMAAELSLTRAIITAWRDLKERRKAVGYSLTGWKLVINRMVLSNEDVERETNEWRRDIEDETEEIYRVELREYERAAVPRNDPSDTTSATNPAGRPDRDAIRAKVLQRVTEQRRQPGSPRLGFDLQQNGVSVTPLEQLPKQEQNRRNDVTRTNVWLRLVVGTSVLSETSRRPIGSDFSVEFDHTFPILLNDLPENIAVEIHESSLSVLATVYVPIPDATCLSNRPFVAPFEFTCPIEHPPSSSSTAVGSGLPYGQLLVSGSLKAGAAWSPDAPPPPSVTHAINALHARTTGHIMDATRIREMISSGALDPNHPNNAELVYLLRSTPTVGATVSPVAYFRLEHLLEEFSFVSDEVFAKSNRYRILELRDKEIGDFRKLKAVPANERDVDVGMLRRWQAQQIDSSIFGNVQPKRPPTGDNLAASKDEATAEFDIAAQAVGGLHEFEVQRIRGARHLQRAREAVIQQLNIAAHKLQLVDVVFEDDVPSIRTGLEALGRAFEARRPLAPKRVPRKKIPGQNLQPGDVNLIISVLRAHIRLTQGSALGSPDELRVYAEVSFQEKTQETSVALGVEPTWNEKMIFSFRAPNDDFSPASLQSANDFIYISIFARKNRILEHDARGDASVVVQRFERRWLGTMKLRWSAVYLNTTVEGTFYVAQSEPSVIGPNQLLISVYATLTPALLLPEGPPSNLPTSEEAALMERAEAFSYKFTQKFSLREVLLTVIDVTGKRVFVSRYLKQLPPPQELIGTDSADVVDRRIARFVSLIPFVSDMAVFPVQIDVWATTEQFLKMLSGDDEEHSCLLASYFLYLRRTAFLAIGAAVPEGRSTYVISETQDKRFVAWDPKTGLPYDLVDPFCPLQTIDCIITPDNVYANIQQSNRSADAKMLLSDKTLWEPFFNPGEFAHDTAPVSAGRDGSTESAEELAKSKEAALRLRLIIRDSIHRELNKWREPGRNALNRLLSHRVQEHLQRLEAQRRDGTPVDFEDLGAELERYGVSGFTLQQPFTSVGAIIDAVRATRVWHISDPEVTYVLAVHVEPYPMTILAVWVYIGIQSGPPTSLLR